jgi:hypothetical protein
VIAGKGAAATSADEVNSSRGAALKVIDCKGLGPMVGEGRVDCSASRRLSSATSPLNVSMACSALRKRRLYWAQISPPSHNPRKKNNTAATAMKMPLLTKKYVAASRLFNRSEREARRGGMEWRQFRLT